MLKSFALALPTGGISITNESFQIRYCRYLFFERHQNDQKFIRHIFLDDESLSSVNPAFYHCNYCSHFSFSNRNPIKWEVLPSNSCVWLLQNLKITLFCMAFIPMLATKIFIENSKIWIVVFYNCSLSIMDLSLSILIKCGIL